MRLGKTKVRDDFQLLSPLQEKVAIPDCASASLTPLLPIHSSALWMKKGWSLASGSHFFSGPPSQARWDGTARALWNRGNLWASLPSSNIVTFRALAVLS